MTKVSQNDGNINHPHPQKNILNPIIQRLLSDLDALETIRSLSYVQTGCMGIEERDFAPYSMFGTMINFFVDVASLSAKGYSNEAISKDANILSAFSGSFDMENADEIDSVLVYLGAFGFVDVVTPGKTLVRIKKACFERFGVENNVDFGFYLHSLSDNNNSFTTDSTSAGHTTRSTYPANPPEVQLPTTKGLLWESETDRK